MAFKNEDDFLDGLFDKVFGNDGEVSDEDQQWFEDLVKWVKENPVEAQQTSQSGTNSPRRRRGDSSTGSPSTRRRGRQTTSQSGSSNYGARSFFG